MLTTFAATPVPVLTVVSVGSRALDVERVGTSPQIDIEKLNATIFDAQAHAQTRQQGCREGSDIRSGIARLIDVQRV
jgi:hypothetical protein